jgi:hypothetical protein
MDEKVSLAMEVDFVSAWVNLLVPLRMNGSNTLSTKLMNRRTELVTRAWDQLYLKAMIVAAMIVDVYSIMVPSFSEMPNCKVLAVVVMVPAAEPGGIESRTWMV